MLKRIIICGMPWMNVEHPFREHIITMLPEALHHVSDERKFNFFYKVMENTVSKYPKEVEIVSTKMGMLMTRMINVSINRLVNMKFGPAVRKLAEHCATNIKPIVEQLLVKEIPFAKAGNII